MWSLTDATVSGCNETINVARNAALENKDKMRSLVSIYAFQSGGKLPSRYILKNEDAATVRHISREDYCPDGCTPLLDAVGSTLSELKAVAATHEDATGIITIITDGMENSSVQYDSRQVANLISQFKEMGWTINLIGANIDVMALGNKLNIDNNLSFSASVEGTRDMWNEYKECQSRRMDDMVAELDIFDKECRLEKRKSASKGFFRKKDK